ncbi:uncharacterized protein LOC111637850 [Centruroides sculpturatus]|uniref:uncharacterized protein LOC111637850 n=1 Tax=Centruroides sculpturatus TaxID=218467 RepID=UPI000C6CB7E0|nr:uncharacterized protein LOC111637850 [Centruroides sculpturatus]
MSSEDCDYDFNVKQTVGKKRGAKPKNIEDLELKKQKVALDQKFELDLTLDKGKSSKIKQFNIKICENQFMNLTEFYSKTYISLTKSKGNYAYNKYNINIDDFKFYKKAFDAMNEHLDKCENV